ncbi:hypothetical protein JTB14_036008 [Gonioctena quinquepunctata]|nr:hypothetical protein JTB14_036008 [Gonioctena quinquepunctata]
MLKRAKSFLVRTKTKEEFDLTESSHLRRKTAITNEVIKEQQIYRAKQKPANTADIIKSDRLPDVSRISISEDHVPEPPAEMTNVRNSFKQSNCVSENNVRNSFLEEMKQKQKQKERNSVKNDHKHSVDMSKHSSNTFLEEMKKKKLQKEHRSKPPESKQMNDEEMYWRPRPEKKVQRSKSTLDKPNAAKKIPYRISEEQQHYF